MTHTPGSWSYQALAGQHDYAVYADATGHDIALVRDFDLANVRLIAAAPDLLVQLKMLVRWAEDQGEQCEFANAAIAKAEGR